MAVISLYMLNAENNQTDKESQVKMMAIISLYMLNADQNSCISNLQMPPRHIFNNAAHIIEKPIQTFSNLSSSNVRPSFLLITDEDME